jgi:protein tyrosine/serine phosphatase
MKPRQADISLRVSLLLKAAIVLVAALLVWYVADHFGRWKDRFVPRKFRVVDAGLIYASGQIDRHLIRQLLVDRHIQVIVCLENDATDPDVADLSAELAAAKELGIARYEHPLSGDGTGDIHAYADAVAAMAQAEKEAKPLLLHCSSGVQRSNGATFYYRVLVQRRDADAAAAEMIRNGFRPRSNPQLIPYLNAHMAEMAALLVAKSVIPAVPNPLPRIHDE